MAKYVRAYHFVGNTLRDGRPIPADGEWLTHDGECVICESGLHASRHPFDALQYAPGPILCLVECGQIEAEQGDKFVCRKRRIIARFDATAMLREFARKCVPAAWAAVRDAAWAAAWDAQRQRFAAMVDAEFAKMEAA